MHAMIAFPVPVPPELAPWLAPIFGLMAVTGFVVLVWQAVRYFRAGDDNTGEKDREDSL